MAFPLVPATLLLITAGLATLDWFLPPDADAPAPDTEPIAPPYTPPYTGGQCNVLYNVTWRSVFVRTGLPPEINTGVRNNIRGRIRGSFNRSIKPASPTDTRFKGDAGIIGTDINGNPQETRVIDLLFGDGVSLEFTILSVVRSDGLPDNCGDLPNPNPSFPIAGTGLAQSSPPDLEVDSEPVTEGLVPLNLAALLAAARAALAAAATLAELAAAIAEVLDLIGKILDDLNPKNRDKYKSTFLYQYGSISNDGFLRFYGDVSNDGFEAIYLDILFTDIPSGYGKFFGELSPNRYIYNRLGHIAFVSPSLGVMEVRELEFPRQSFSIPKDSIGFFYNLGLNGSVKANASCIYEREEVPAE